jgi:hypothetical protein
LFEETEKSFTTRDNDPQQKQQKNKEKKVFKMWGRALSVVHSSHLHSRNTTPKGGLCSFKTASPAKTFVQPKRTFFVSKTKFSGNLDTVETESGQSNLKMKC